MLRVSATKLRASASCEDARKLDILTATKREAEPPIPIALTVLEMVQYEVKPLGQVCTISTMARRVARASS